MRKNAKRRKKARVQFNANITSKFDLLALEPELGFYYLNLYDHCQKAHIYWCYAGDPGGLMRLNQTGIAQNDPPHYNIILPDSVDALALKRLVAGLDTSLFLDPEKYGWGEDEDGSLYIGSSNYVLQWMNKLNKDIATLSGANCIMSFRTVDADSMQRYLGYFDLEITANDSEEEVRDLARVLGESIIAENDTYSWRLPWAMLELWKTLRGVNREKEKREAKVMSLISSGYREVKLEDAIFHTNVAVNM